MLFQNFIPFPLSTLFKSFLAEDYNYLMIKKVFYVFAVKTQS